MITEMLTGRAGLEKMPCLFNSQSEDCHRHVVASMSNCLNCIVRLRQMASKAFGMLLKTDCETVATCRTYSGEIALSMLNGMGQRLHRYYYAITAHFVERNRENGPFSIRNLRFEIGIQGLPELQRGFLGRHIFLSKLLDQRLCMLSNGKNSSKLVFSFYAPIDDMLAPRVSLLKKINSEGSSNGRNGANRLHPSWPSFFIQSEMITNHPDRYQDGKHSKDHSSNFFPIPHAISFQKGILA